MKNPVDWKSSTAAALALFASQVAIGFVEGGVQPGLQSFAWSSTASLVLAAAVFAFLSYRVRRRAWLHSLLALAVLALISFATGAVLATWSSGPHTFFVVLEWLTLLAALVVGVPFGAAVSRRGGTADA